MTINEFIASRGISMTAVRVDTNPHMVDGANMDHWKCVLRMGRERLTVPFSMGYGHNGKRPEPADVLNCLADDAAQYVNTSSFEDWAAEFGFDPTARKWIKTYKVIGRQSEKLRKFLGDDDCNTLMWDTERL